MKLVDANRAVDPNAEEDELDRLTEIALDIAKH